MPAAMAAASHLFLAFTRDSYIIQRLQIAKTGKQPFNTLFLRAYIHADALSKLRIQPKARRMVFCCRLLAYSSFCCSLFYFFSSIAAIAVTICALGCGVALWYYDCACQKYAGNGGNGKRNPEKTPESERNPLSTTAFQSLATHGIPSFVPSIHTKQAGRKWAKKRKSYRANQPVRIVSQLGLSIYSGI